ncbi:alpha/beta fold hydrolase [Janthinobacterium sp. 17J80-10]|uniref:alpha/beta fold hydrolase n=1 Tax=Janthinobacterium sp. 17J80-10 TaxID=2497863 RepID=UPI001005A50A|nr:alpha/beta fold hydrolase [Janthinobacterium sp. 17J80-10]QAU35027.1 alpha/beta fold hydrolase [Janthinobacterium sp. 17J80-10]
MPINANSMPAHIRAPFCESHIAVGGGHRLYCAQYGEPGAPAAVVLHGGPGSGCKPAMLDWFDLSRQRVVLLDQRGAGKSVPLGETAHNHTAHLVEDIEQVRVHLRIPRWLVVGGSWGATLGLSYAGRYPAAVHGLVLRGAFLASAREVHRFFQSLQAEVPDAWARLTAGWSVAQQRNVLQSLTGLLQNGTCEQRNDAARRWHDYEEAIMRRMMASAAQTGQLANSRTVPGGLGSTPPESVLAQTITKYRLQAHYLSQACFTSERALFRCARRTAHIPTILIHGTHDLVCPPENAQRLKRFMPHADLRWVQDGTHTPADPKVLAALRLAIRDVMQK